MARTLVRGAWQLTPGLGRGRALAVALAGLVLAAWLPGQAVAAPPSNDNLAQAITIQSPAGTNPAVGPATNVEATKEIAEPSHAGDAGGASVWYRWTAPASGSVILDTCQANFDTLLAVYTGSSLGALTPVAASDDAVESCAGNHSRVTFNATAGTSYAIAVDGKAGATGQFGLTFVLNDDFAGAVDLGSSFGHLVSNIGASKQSGEPDHAGDPGGASLWYRYTAPKSAKVILATCNSGVDTLLAVYTGSAVNALSTVQSNDDAPGCGASGTRSRLSFNAVAGTTYRVAVDGKAGATGPVTLTISTNDDFADATPATQGLTGIGFLGTNVGATKEGGEPSHAGDAGGASVWATFTPDRSGPYRIDTCGTAFGFEFDTLLAVYTGGSLGGLTEVASNDDTPGCGSSSTRSSVTIDAVAGTTYRIAIDGKGGATGTYSFAVTFDNNDFENALDVGTLPAPQFGSNVLADKETGEPAHAGNSGGKSLWYRFTPSRSGSVLVGTCFAFAPPLDTLLAVYTGSAVDALTPVAASDNTPGCAGGTGSRVSFDATAGTTYWIAVDGKDGAGAGFILTFVLNDRFADAGEIGPDPVPFPLTNDGAAKEAGEPNHAGNAGAASVWHTFTPSSDAIVTLDTCTAPGAFGFDTLLAVYTGSSVGALTPVTSNDDSPGCGPNGTGSRVEFTALAGTTYRIAVDGKGGATGAFNLGFAQRPVNDDFGGALDVGASPGTVLGSTATATREAGEPNHAGDAGGKSVWYRFTAPSSGTVTVDTCGAATAFDTLLAVYTGSSLGGLSPVASNDDASLCGPGGTGSRVTFVVAAGTTYRIAVDGKGGAGGNFELAFDTIGPSPAISAPAAGSFTADTTPQIAGTAGTAPGDGVSMTVRVYEGSDTSGALARTLVATASGGNWSVDVTPALPAGTYTVRAEQSDAAGHTGTSNTRTFTVDTAAPVVSITSPADGSSTEDTTPTIGGTGGTAPGDGGGITVRVHPGSDTSGPAVRTVNATVGGGSWSVDVAPALDPGTYTVQAEQSDAAGHTGTSNTRTFTVVAPVPPTGEQQTTTQQTTTQQTTTPPAPPEPEARPATLQLSGSTLRPSSTGVLSLTVVNSNDFSVGGTVTVKTTKAVTVRAARKRVVTFGRARFTLGAGKRGRVKLRLSSRNAKLLRKLRRVRVRVTVAVTTPSRLTSTRTLTLVAPKTRR